MATLSAFIGAFLIIVGVSFIYWPAGLVVAGLITLTAAVLLDLASSEVKA